MRVVLLATLVKPGEIHGARPAPGAGAVTLSPVARVGAPVRAGDVVERPRGAGATAALEHRPPAHLHTVDRALALPASPIGARDVVERPCGAGATAALEHRPPAGLHAV